MGPKKAAKNDFWYFLQDQKNVLRREGHVWNNMDDLVAICSPRWKQVPERERARLNTVITLKIISVKYF